MKKRKYFIPIITILTASLFCGCGSQKKEYVPGEVTDAGYESEFLGLRFTTPEDFNLLGKVEIDGMMETAMPTADDITKETQKEYEDNTQITEFMATSEDAMTLASVTLEKTTESLEDYIETFKTDYFENMDNNVINDVTIEINSQIVGDIVNFGSTFYGEAVASNNGNFIGKDENGYYNALETEETMNALNWALDMLSTYDYPQPEGSEWNYWQEAFVSGCGAFIAGETYQAGSDWSEMEDDFGFVCFPKGPKASDYTNIIGNNPCAIPACYDADKAWKIAFAYDLYTEPIPGFEDYDGRDAGFYNSFRDTESVELTIARMKENGRVTYHTMIPGLDLGPDVIWGISKDNTPAQQAEAIRNTWASYLEEANK